MEFREASRAFFEQVRANHFELISSGLVVDELAEAPQEVRSFFRELAGYVHIEDISVEAIQQRDAYLAGGHCRPCFAG